ncbi:hypothetical protein SU45_00190 [Brachyspira hyodysenteriae]|uniref:hypothetical protein n=1 Tax=Brachyspira hyodysenteriae TaxID=159 RepID=UPI00063DD2F1|nr:hypothetical protein [Brachyspira hyodysenteriae]KLI19603.1 hypothetical protein SU45_00190 [Brachyspira hyodysenteriae]
MHIKVYAGKSKRLINYNSIIIKKSIDEICNTADIVCPLSELKKVEKHDRIIIKALMWNNEERNVTTTLVDDISAVLNNNQKQMTIHSRSYARDIIDSTDSGRIEGGTLVEVVRKIAQKYNSNIVVSHYPTNKDNSPPIASFTWENESVWQKLLTIAENNGYAIASNQASNLYVWARNTYLANNANHKIIEGKNIKSASLNKRGYEQFNCYRIKGNYGIGEKFDYKCDTKRVFTLFFTDENISQKELLNRAESELKRRKSDELNINMYGWGLSYKEIENKKIKNNDKIEVFYEPKQKIKVNIPSFGIDDYKVIKSVELVLNNEEFSSNIILVDEGAV